MKFDTYTSEIITMGQIDQTMREAGGIDPEKWDVSVDHRNTTRMKEIVESIGWPTVTKVGAEASHFAWLLVQHADHDVLFQKKCLNLMNSQPVTEVRLQELAYLEDRVRTNEGRPQLYGTQFFTDRATNKFGSRPINNLDELDARRMAVGLEPFIEYERRMLETYKNRMKLPNS